jgi:2-polyprenyl-3-methyl-5-hydroxy-6-metoxy-1,4-benzoquinol methylase
MSVHRDLDPERANELRAVIAGETPVAPSVPPEQRPGLKQRLAGVARRVAGPIVNRVLTSRIDSAVTPLRYRVEDVEQSTEDVRGLPAKFELLKAETIATNAVAVNLELLKSEFRALLAAVEELGMAIAPATGLDGAAERIAELRERVNALERRQRDVPRAEPRAEPAPSSPPVEQPGVQSTLFDYVGFERRFRGDPDVVLAQLKERYASALRDSSPVLDVGCGRGELLSVLAGEGIETLGVDTDPSMVAEARARGLEVYEKDAVAFLRERPEHSLGAIIALHVVEHLQLDALIELLELAATRLRPGGLFIAETPNPATLIVLGNSYILDPTHVRPLHPSLFTFLCEGAGFRSARLEFYSPAEGYHLPLIDDPSAPPWAATVNAAFERLNEVLFGPQDYAIFATTPPAP